MAAALKRIDLALQVVLVALLVFILSGRFHGIVPCSSGMEGPTFVPWLNTKAALLFFLPVLILLPPGILLIEKLVASGSRRFVLTIALSQALLLPAFPAWILVNPQLLRKAVTNGVQISLPGELRFPFLVASLASAAFGVAQLRRKARTRMAVIVVAAIVFLLLNISNHTLFCYTRTDLDLGAAVSNVPIILGLLFVHAALGLSQRPSGNRRWPEGCRIACMTLMFWLALVPLRVKGSWAGDELASFWGAQLTPNGELSLYGYPRTWRFAFLEAGVLLRRTQGEACFRELVGRPVIPIRPSDWVWATAAPVDRLAVASIPTLLQSLMGGWGRQMIVSLPDGKLRQRTGLWQTSLRVLCAGPDHSWIGEEWRSGRLVGDTIDGRRFEIATPCSNFGGAVVGGHFVGFSRYSPLRPAGEPGCLVNVDLTTGNGAQADMPGGNLEAIQISPDGTAAFLASRLMSPPRLSFTIFESGLLRLTGLHAPEARGIPVACWSSGRVDSLLDAKQYFPAGRIWGIACRNLSGKTFLARLDPPYVVWQSGLAIRDPVERSNPLTEIDTATGDTRVISPEAHDVEWLPDSIVFTEVTRDQERVVRYWPEGERRETLFAISIPPSPNAR